MTVPDIAVSINIGADEISVSGMLLTFPRRIAKYYDIFRRHFFTDWFIYYDIFRCFGIFRYVLTGFITIIAIIIGT